MLLSAKVIPTLPSGPVASTSDWKTRSPAATFWLTPPRRTVDLSGCRLDLADRSLLRRPGRRATRAARARSGPSGLRSRHAWKDLPTAIERPRPTTWCSMSRRRRPRSVRVWTGCMESCARSKLPRDTTSRLQIVVEELFSNTIKYGYGGECERPVHLRLRCSPRVELVYQDAAPPFDPTAWRDPAPHAAPGSERRPPGHPPGPRPGGERPLRAAARRQPPHASLRLRFARPAARRHAFWSSWRSRSTSWSWPSGLTFG